MMRCRGTCIRLLMLLVLGTGSSHCQEAEAEITLLATGDTMLDAWVEQLIADTSYAYPFMHLRQYTASSDLFFTNLEAPFGTGGIAFDKQFTFRVKPRMVNVLLSGGINLVSLANNHMMDFGPSCLEETLEILGKHRIHHAGAGMNLRESRKASLFEVNGLKIGMLAYSLTFPEEFWATDTSAGTCFPYDTFVYDDVKRLDADADLVIVSCHWGQELLKTPKKYQIELAHQLIDSGADIILGHHPHVVQGIEFYKGKLVAYSLGNFIFASYSEKARDSMLLSIKGRANYVGDVKIIPINVYNRDVEFQPVPLTGGSRQNFLDELKELSMELNTDPIVITDEGKIELLRS